MNKNKRFARPSSAFFISVHFMPVLGKSATWNDHFSSFTENVNTAANLNFLPRLLHRTFKFSSWVVPLAFKSQSNWHNDGKDAQTWTCNFERRFQYRCVVDLKLPIDNRKRLWHRGVARIFQRGGHTVSKWGYSPDRHYGQGIVMAFSPSVVGYLVKKGLQKGWGQGHPGPPWLRPCLGMPQFLQVGPDIVLLWQESRIMLLCLSPYSN